LEILKRYKEKKNFNLYKQKENIKQVWLNLFTKNNIKNTKPEHSSFFENNIKNKNFDKKLINEKYLDQENKQQIFKTKKKPEELNSKTLKKNKINIENIKSLLEENKTKLPSRNLNKKKTSFIDTNKKTEEKLNLISSIKGILGLGWKTYISFYKYLEDASSSDMSRKKNIDVTSKKSVSMITNIITSAKDYLYSVKKPNTLQGAIPVISILVKMINILENCYKFSKASVAFNKVYKEKNNKQKIIATPLSLDIKNKKHDTHYLDNIYKGKFFTKHKVKNSIKSTLSNLSKTFKNTKVKELLKQENNPANLKKINQLFFNSITASGFVKSKLVQNIKTSYIKNKKINKKNQQQKHITQTNNTKEKNKKTKQENEKSKKEKKYKKK
jgi:hypothetical protein